MENDSGFAEETLGSPKGLGSFAKLSTSTAAIQVRREAYRQAVDHLCNSRFGGSRSRIMLVQLGAELQDNTVPNPDHDIYVLARPNSAAEGCCCLPKTAVTFREPGGTAFQLELPLNSSLKDITAALIAAVRSSRREPNGNVAEGVGRTDERDARDCTLIVGGKKMSNAYLLGDYLLMKSAMRRTPTILVLWHSFRQDPTKAAAAAAAETRLPVARFAVAAPVPLLIRLQEEGRKGRQLRSRRSVKRRCKCAARFSGLKRGARCGLGIRPLS